MNRLYGIFASCIKHSVWLVFIFWIVCIAMMMYTNNKMDTKVSVLEHESDSLKALLYRTEYGYVQVLYVIEYYHPEIDATGYIYIAKDWISSDDEFLYYSISSDTCSY